MTVAIAELIERLEKAEGPSRELDALVCRATGWHRVEPRFTSNKKGGWIAPGDFIGTHSDGGPILDSMLGTTIHRDPAPFTSSLDAAMDLLAKVLPEAQLLIGFKQTATTKPWARVGNWTAPDATGPTPALALCIAILKAVQERRP